MIHRIRKVSLTEREPEPVTPILRTTGRRPDDRNLPGQRAGSAAYHSASPARSRARSKVGMTTFPEKRRWTEARQAPRGPALGPDRPVSPYSAAGRPRSRSSRRRAYPIKSIDQLGIAHNRLADQLDPGPAQLLERTVHSGPRDAGGQVEQDGGGEAGLRRVERGRPHAVVGGDPNDVHCGHLVC